MSRLLAIIIAAIVATSPAMAQKPQGRLGAQDAGERAFFNSLRTLGNHCQHQAVIGQRLIGGRFRNADDSAEFTASMGVCMAWLAGVRAGLPYDLNNPEILCIKNHSGPGEKTVEAFTEYYSDLTMTRAGRALLREFETAPGLFTALALAKIYGCTATDDLDTFSLGPMEGYAPPQGDELDFSDLIPEKKPR